MQSDIDSVRRTVVAPRQYHLIASGEDVIGFDKLQQFREPEQRHLRRDPLAPAAWHRQVGREVSPLFSGECEPNCLQRQAPLEILFAAPADGAELLVLAGDVVVDA